MFQDTIRSDRLIEQKPALKPNYAILHDCFTTNQPLLMRKILPAIIGILFLSTQLSAQNVGIGTNNPQVSAMLDVNSTDKGFLPPRMTTIQRNAIANKVAGLMIFNTSTACVEMYNGESWISLCSSLPSSFLPKTLLGSNQEDYASFIQQTADSGYIIGGSTNGFENGDVTGGAPGQDLECWIIKLGKTGNVEWTRVMGGGSYDELKQIRQTADGGYIFCAMSSSSATGDVTGTSNGSNDYWIVKLDATGATTWNILIGGEYDEYATAIIQTADGGYAVGGYSTSSASGDVTGTLHGANPDYWIVKLSSTGTIQWNVLIGGAGEERLYSLRQTADGGYIAAGVSTEGNSGNVTGTVSGAFDFWVVKLTSTGAITWNKLIGGTGEELAYAVQQTADGGYIVAGTSDSPASGNISVSTHGLIDYLVVKLDAAGNIVWNRMLGGSGDEQDSSDPEVAIQQTLDGGYIVAGTSNSSASGDVTQNSFGFSDAWVVKLDASGNIVWNKLLGGNDLDLLVSIQQTFDGGYIFTGYTNSSANGTVSGTNHGGKDIWITKLDAGGNIE